MLTSSVEVLWTARYDYQPHWRLEKHKHEFFQMIYFLSGSGTLYLDEKEYPIATGLLLLIKPDCLHALNASSLVKTLDIKFWVRDRRLRRLLLSASSRLEKDEPWIADSFERIRHEGERKSFFYRELCNAYMVELLLQYLRNDNADDTYSQNELSAQEMSGDWIVQQATQFIRKHYADDCGLEQIARIVGRSDRHVRQHFKDALGVSPGRYLLQYRIQKAQELIEHSSDSFKEIAAQIGFKTVHHFARAFHEICGETPGGWRKKYQSGICKDINIDPGFVNTNWTTPPENLRDNVISL